MFAKFHEKNFFIVPFKSWAVDVMITLPSFFSNLRYDSIDDYAILYKKGIEPRDCLIMYLDYSIKYHQDIIDSLSRPSDDGIDFRLAFPEMIDGYEKEIAELKKARKKIES